MWNASVEVLMRGFSHDKRAPRGANETEENAPRLCENGAGDTR